MDTNKLKSTRYSHEIIRLQREINETDNLFKKSYLRIKQGRLIYKDMRLTLMKSRYDNETLKFIEETIEL